LFCLNRFAPGPNNPPSTDRSPLATDRHPLPRNRRHTVPFAVSDAVSQVLASALDGVTTRQQVIADNIANVDTPGFRPTSVDFESQLKSAIADGDFNAGSPVDPGVTETP